MGYSKMPELPISGIIQDVSEVEIKDACKTASKKKKKKMSDALSTAGSGALRADNPTGKALKKQAKGITNKKKKRKKKSK